MSDRLRSDSQLLAAYGFNVLNMKIDDIREFCLSFPHATEDVKWGKDLCFSVGGKVFCVTGLETPGSQVSFKCTPERFAELVEREGIVPAPYVARYHWVAVEDTTALNEEEFEDLISRSYLLVYENLPAGLRKELSRS